MSSLKLDAHIVQATC